MVTTLVVILVSVDREELELWESDGRVVFFCFRLVETELVLGVENGVEFRLSEVVEFAKGVSTIVISLSSLSLDVMTPALMIGQNWLDLFFYYQLSGFCNNQSKHIIKT